MWVRVPFWGTRQSQDAPSATLEWGRSCYVSLTSVPRDRDRQREICFGEKEKNLKCRVCLEEEGEEWRGPSGGRAVPLLDQVGRGAQG